VFSSLLLSGPAIAERSFSDFSGLGGLQRITTHDGEGNRLDLVGYIGAERKPVIAVVPGSLCAPLFAALDSDPPDKAYATVPLLSEKERRSLDSHLIYLERRNVVSLETMRSAPEFSIEQIFKFSPCSEGHGGVTLDHRVSDVIAQLSWIRQQPWAASVRVVGVSEGADVAASVAAARSHLVDALMLIGGAGPSQFFDFATFARQGNDIEGVRSAFSVLDQFLRSSPPPTYQGSSAERWQSFAIANSVLDSLSKSDDPLFIAHGEKDESVPIASADLVAVELMRRQPQRAIFYWAFLGGDHMLGTPSGSRIGEAITQFSKWANGDPVGRTFRTD
jgi:pimeloyl-ACP methyl ester carboxylesterase